MMNYRAHAEYITDVVNAAACNREIDHINWVMSIVPQWDPFERTREHMRS